MDRAEANVGWNFARIAKYTAIAIGILLALVVALAAALLWWMSGGVFTVDRFNEKRWSAMPTNVGQSDCYRGGMANDIKDRLLKPGMPRADVERLLGQPDTSLSTPAEYRYVLGMCSGLKWDYDDLHVYFTNDGKIDRAAIIQH